MERENRCGAREKRRQKRAARERERERQLEKEKMEEIIASSIRLLDCSTQADG